MPTHQFNEGGLAAPRLIGGEQVVVADASQPANFLGQGQVAQEQAKSAGAHDNQAPGRVSSKMTCANSVQLIYFEEKRIPIDRSSFGRPNEEWLLFRSFPSSQILQGYT
jgi:hypothetical protein